MGDIDMKIPEGWPTEEMLFAACEACDDMFQTDFIRAFKAALAAAPTPPAPVLQLETQLSGNDIKTLSDYIARIKAPPAQEAKPVAWMDKHGRVISHRVRATGDAIVIEQYNIPLYTHAPSDKLRQAAEELVAAYDHNDNCIVELANLRKEMEGKS